MRFPAFSVASVLALSSLTAFVMAPSVGCAPSTDDGTEAAEQASTASDLALAREVVALLGGDSGRCKNCHGMNASRIRTWGTTMKEIDAACFAPESMAPADRINCLRSTPTSPGSAFSPSRLGLYAAGASQDQFKQLFQAAFPAGSWESEYATFAQRASMPRGGGPALTAAEFGKLKGWVLRGMPQLDEAFRPVADAGSDGGGPTGPCTPRTTPELTAHLASMKSAGWGARLADQATPMFGCGTSTNPLECLTQLPDATGTFGSPGVEQKLRRLHQQPLSSRYWVRSSADGRYIGYGLYTTSKIVDLTKPASAPAITVAADYDPYFLPSNDGFAFAGSHSGQSVRVCRQSLLADVGGATNPSIELTEAKCASIGRNVYQSIGSSLEGNRYFVTWGAHENDDGGNNITAPLPAAFGSTATTTFTPMVNNGQSYRAQSPVNVVLRGEGDMILSPSSLLAATRFGTGQKHVGYRVRFVKAEQPTSGSLRIDTPLGAEVCMPGAKASFSFDERYMVTHQYVDHSEPDQASLPEGSSNIMIADLATGQQIRLTSSKEGVFALYPHFRADGWLYFVVRDMNDRTEYVVASDIAVRLTNANP
jgi:hypothetical protein